jgi:RNA polymerase sigma-70 factor (ECF subfamily)
MPSAGDSQPDLTPAVRDAVLQSRKQFVAAAGAVRPRLHRFCARMCGSSLDGEDLVQETLAEAFYNLPALKDPARFEPWLFRIAYHKCIDFLRRERRRDDDVPFDEEHDQPGDADHPADAPIDDALAALVSELPPKERASVLLKDVLDYPIDEVADIADSTVGGVKAALHRARVKLRAM